MDDPNAGQTVKWTIPNYTSLPMQSVSTLRTARIQRAWPDRLTWPWPNEMALSFFENFCSSASL